MAATLDFYRRLGIEIPVDVEASKSRPRSPGGSG